MIVFALFVLCAMYLSSMVFHWNGVELNVLVRDPAAQFGIPIYAGFFSWLGVFALVATTAVLAMCASVATRGRRPMIVAAILTAALALDDSFMFHDAVWSERWGYSELLIYGFYGLMVLLLGVMLSAEPPSTGASGLLVPAAFLVGSAAIDATFLSEALGWRAIWVEDALKMTGFASWLFYWFSAARAYVRASEPAAADRDKPTFAMREGSAGTVARS
ncbi:hypothetical protein [Jannaschia sp. LMIT008]|uniref:hypothetical protein n=1 Tax=Jannaschia maritima TaxID=3032585 RepID=UPI00281236AD|nr:hypothetical protein [Jannaschia sp. LMIT008]